MMMLVVMIMLMTMMRMEKSYQHNTTMSITGWTKESIVKVGEKEVTNIRYGLNMIMMAVIRTPVRGQ